MADSKVTNVADITLAGCPLVVDDILNPKVLATPFAVQIGSGGGEYSDYEQWAFFAQDSFQSGQGFTSPTSDGFRHGEIESRHKQGLMLPPKLEFHCETSECCKIIEHCGEVYLVEGGDIYKWDEVAGKPSVFCSVEGTNAIDAIVYDGYIFLANGEGNPVTWVEIANCENQGSVGTSDGGVCADGFSIAGSTLYSWCCNVLCFTASPRVSCNDPLINPDNFQVYFLPGDDPPDQQQEPRPWFWLCYELDCSCADCITGVDTIFDQQPSQPYTFISTTCSLYALYPGDVLTKIRDWPYESAGNGVGLTNHFNSIYAPVGENLYRWGTDGIFFNVSGTREEPYPCHKRGDIVDIHGIGPDVYAVMQPYDPNGSPSIWVSSASGWHFLACLPAGELVCDSMWDKSSRRFFVCTDKGIYSLFMPYVNESPIGFPGAQYEPEGFVDIGTFSGNLLEIDKYFHSIYIDGVCISEETPVKIWWRDTDPDDHCAECSPSSDYSEWQLLGTATENTSEIRWACGEGPVQKKIWMRLQLCTSDCDRTPIVKAYRIKYLPNVAEKFQWTYRFTLPWCDMRDRCQRVFEDYDQNKWVCCIEDAVRTKRPVPFTDVDGFEYHVWVTSATRSTEIAQINQESGDIKYNYSWSLTLLEVCPDPAEPCVYSESDQEVNHSDQAIDRLLAAQSANAS